MATESLFTVPGAAREDRGLDAWADRLNAWYAAQIAAFVAGAREPDGRRRGSP